MNTNLNQLFENLSSAYRHNNLDAIFNLHHPYNELFNMGKDQLRTVLSNYELDVSFENLNILQEDEDVRIVRVSQITKKENGPEFRDNEIDMIVVLKPHNDTIKILSTASIDTRFL
ncbi:hypothetical protein M0D21_22850 [Aquimarina sp. D1M17]|uniref:hypothetical protein n=1 Tax=Aquimarina acroporae TaxID=2937283 RepID=UPI0020BD81BC|nr:hypothetical protein [Aquimarina acroporae]MCK8524430.1 hypothetical protein [Aquimarina acroporae]